MRTRFFLFLLLVGAGIWFGSARPDRVIELTETAENLQFEAELRGNSLMRKLEQFEALANVVAQGQIVHDVASGDFSTLDQLSSLAEQLGVESFEVQREGEDDTFPAPDMMGKHRKTTKWRESLQRAFGGQVARFSYHNDDGTPRYVFFTPHQYAFSALEDEEAAEAKNAILITEISLGDELEEWNRSDIRIEVVTDDNETLIANKAPYSESSQSHQRRLANLNAVLITRADSPNALGIWVFRSLALLLCGLLGLFLWEQQRERREAEAALAESRKHEAIQLEEEVSVTKSELGVATEKLKISENMALVGQISRSLGSDLTQPLAAIKNYGVAAKRLMERGDFPKAQLNIENITQLSDRISRMVGALRSFSDTEEMMIVELEVEPMIERAALDLVDRYPAVQEFCFIETGEDFSENQEILADRSRFMQVMNNLMITAWEACRDQEKPEMVIYLSERANTVLISIDHNGSDKSILDENESADAQKIYTSSLGFTISKSLIEDMNGFLSHAPSNIGGERVEIVLPKPIERPPA